MQMEIRRLSCGSRYDPQLVGALSLGCGVCGYGKTHHKLLWYPQQCMFSTMRRYFFLFFFGFFFPFF